MAHYVAELITSAELNTDSPKAQHDCAQAILQMWEHRSAFPGPNAPLASFEPIARALEHFDPERPTWGHLDAYKAGEPNIKPNAEAAELALKLDRSLGGIVRFLLHDAVDAAVSTEQKWLDATDSVDEDFSIVSSIIETFGYGTSESNDLAAKLKAVENARALLDEVADKMRDRAAE